MKRLTRKQSLRRIVTIRSKFLDLLQHKESGLTIGEWTELHDCYKTLEDILIGSSNKG